MLTERQVRIMSTINSILAKNISLYRKQKSLTQEQLAELIGVSYQAVSKWETEKCLPDITVLPKLSDVFECNIDDLFSKTSNCNNSILIIFNTSVYEEKNSEYSRNILRISPFSSAVKTLISEFNFSTDAGITKAV